MIFYKSDEEIEEIIEYRKHFSDVISRDFKIPQEGIAFISFDDTSIKCIMGYRKSGRVATHIDRLSFKNPIILSEPLVIEDIHDNLPVKLKSHFIRQLESHISNFSEKVEKGFLDFIQKVRPEIYDKIGQLKLRLRRQIPEYKTKSAEIIAQEKDAVDSIFKMFHFEESDIPTWSSNDSSAPFLKGYNHLTVREDPMVNHDSQVFGDWSKIGQYSQGAVEFEKENQKITIMNVNRQPLEKTMGVDLLIYHHTFQSYIFIQYKRMTKEKDIYVYRLTDSSYLSELKRMKDFKSILNTYSSESLKNYRLNNELFYFKLCPARIENLNTNRMVSGMYVPLELWEILLKDNSTNGPKGGKLLSFNNTGRYFNNSQFINLSQNGWIGSKIDNVETITNIILDSVNSEKSLIIAEYEDIVKEDTKINEME